MIQKTDKLPDKYFKNFRYNLIMYWIIYALGAQAAVSVSNLVDKVLVSKYIKDSSIIVIFVGIVAFIIGILLFFFRGFPVFSLHQIIVILLAGILLEFYLVPYFKALEISDPSRVIPLFQLIPVLTLAFSSVILHESLSFNQYLGFTLIILSSLVISLRKINNFLVIDKVLWYMFVSSTLFSLSVVLFKLVVYSQNVWDAVAYESVGIGIGSWIIVSLYGKERKFIRHARKLSVEGWVALSLSELFYMLYRFLMALAISLGPVTLVNVISGFQPVFVFIYGLFVTIFMPKLLRENITGEIIARKSIAIIVIFLGLYLINA